MRYFTLALIIPALFLLALCAAPAEAGVNRWTPVGPEGGTITSLAVDPATRSVYSATSGGVFVSTNGGGSWEHRSHGLHSAEHVAVSSVPIPIVYASGGDTFYRSLDGGASWVGNDTLRWIGENALAVDPSDSSKVYAGTVTEGVFMSSDGGVSWTRALEDTFCGAVHSVVINKTSPSTIYAGCEGQWDAPFFKSTDGGVTWTAGGLTSPDGGGRYFRLSLDPDTAGVLYMSALFLADWTTYKSTDDGATWTELLTEGPVMAGSGGVVFAGKYRSSDGGISWQELSLPFTPTAMAFDPGDPATVYAGLESGVYKSTDAGVTWRQTRGPFATEIQVLEINQESTLYAMVPWLGLRKGVAGGTRWRRADAGLPLDDIIQSSSTLALAADPAVPSNLYLGWWRGFARSSDGGASWTATSYDRCVVIRELAVDPRDPGRIYAAGSLGEGTCEQPGSVCTVFRSDNAGATWKCIGSESLDEVTELVVDPSSQPSRIYVGTVRKGVWVTDREDTWRKLKGLSRFSNFITAFAVDPTDSRRLYAGDPNGRLYKSTDRGATWADVSRGVLHGQIRSIVVDSQRPQTVYAVDRDGIYMSGNGGRTWRPFNEGLPSAPWTLLLDPKNPRKLYAPTEHNGVYVHERR